MQEPNTNEIQSVKTAFDILSYIQDSGEVGVSEVAEALSISKSTAYNHLSTLVALDCLVKSNERYRIGLKFLQLGHHAREQYRIYQAAKTEADQLANETGERVQVMVAENYRGIYIYQTSGEKAIQTDSHIGSTVNLHSTAVGKAFLAHLPESELSTYLDQIEFTNLTHNTITDPDRLMDQLEDVRDQGYATNLEEAIQGMNAIGAPIFTEDDEVLGAISISIPTTRIQNLLEEENLPDRVKRSAQVITVKTTYS